MLFGRHLIICHVTITTVRMDDARRYHLLLNEGLTYQSPFSSLHQLITMKTTLQQGSYIFIPVLLFSPTYHDEDNVNLEWSLLRDTFHGYISITSLFPPHHERFLIHDYTKELSWARSFPHISCHIVQSSFGMKNMKLRCLSHTWHSHSWNSNRN